MSLGAAIAISAPREIEACEPVPATVDEGVVVAVPFGAHAWRPSAAVRRFAALLGRHRGRLGWLAALLVLGFLGKAAIDVVADVEIGAASAAVSAMPAAAIGLSVAFTVLSFATLVVYDLSALRHVGRSLPLAAVVRTSFCAYAVGNTAGFGALSGGAVRYRCYSRLGLPPEEIAAVVAFVAVAFGFGLVAVAAAALLVTPPAVAGAMGLDPLASRLVAAAVLGLLALLLLPGARRWGVAGLAFAAPTRRIVLRQFVVTAVDVAFAAAALFVLLPQTGLGFGGFLAVYAVATGLGVLSNIPAGLGVFETVIIAALGPAADLETVLAALAVYRIVYHGLPLALAGVLLAGAEASLLLERAADLNLVASRDGVAAKLASLFAGAAGAGLLVRPLAGTAVDPLALAASGPWLAAGLALLAASRGLARRVAGAWWVGMAAAGAGLSLALADAAGPRWPEAAACALLLAVLAPQRSLFGVPSRLSAGIASLPWLLCIGGLGAAALAIGRPGAGGLGLQALPVSPVLLPFALVAGAAALAVLLRPVLSAEPDVPADASLREALRIVEAQGAGDAHLVRMGDKSILLSDDGEAFIMYARQGRSFIALFDPVGSPAAWPGLVWRFIETARASGCRAVFYQISPALLATCADAGLRAFKLGEQALVDLERFDMKGGRWANLRRATNRAERDGLEFAVVPAADVPAAMPALEAVSSEWLAHHNVREKSFSLGSFDPAYLAAQPVAVLRLDGRIVAFASLLQTARRETAFIDLMRFVPGVHRGTMDLLFVKIIEHLKAEGFQTLNLGMAPLAGMADRADAPLWNRVGRAVFEFGERLYNFKGLLAFKSKFEPDWQPRYLAVSGGINPYLALMDVAILIGGGLRGIFRK